MAKLIQLTKGTRRELSLGEFNTLGRHPDNSIQILDRTVAKEHAHLIRRDDGSFLLKDLGSLQGTFIGGTRISEVVLKPGDEIVMGSSQLIYVEDDEPARKEGSREPSSRFPTAQDLLNPIQQHYEKLRLTHELGQAIIGITDLEILLPLITDKLLAIVPADRVAIELLEAGELKPACEKRKNAKPTDEKTAPSMNVPLFYGEERLGLIQLDFESPANELTETDSQIVNGIANQAALAVKSARAKKAAEEAEKRASLSRFLSPKHQELVRAGSLQLNQPGAMHQATILFVQIRNFPAIASKRTANELTELLNEYFIGMSELLFKYDGTLERYTGDELLGLFGALVPIEDAHWQAASCAFEMQSFLAGWNKHREQNGQEPFEVVIGIHTGLVVTSRIGAVPNPQLTVIGDELDIAAFLCNRHKPDQIIASDATVEGLSGRVSLIALPPLRALPRQRLIRCFVIMPKEKEKESDFKNEPTRPG